jgi:hypothetical protein
MREWYVLDAERRYSNYPKSVDVSHALKSVQDKLILFYFYFLYLIKYQITSELTQS